MHHLFRYKVAFFLVLSFFFISNDTIAQFGGGRDNYNFRDFQKKAYYFGMTLGLNSSGYRLNQSTHFINNDSINITEAAAGGGFILNGIINLKLGDFFDFCFGGGCFEWAVAGLGRIKTLEPGAALFGERLGVLAVVGLAVALVGVALTTRSN